MKNQKKMMASVLSSALFVAAPINIINPTNTFATGHVSESSTDEFKVENSIITEDTQSFSLVSSDVVIDFDIKYENDNVTVKTITNDMEAHSFTYNKSDDFAIIDGEIMELEFYEFIDSNLVVSELDESLSPINSTRSTKKLDDTPVYVTSSNISFSKEVSSIGNTVTVIGGVIAVASLMGVTIPKKVIEKKVADWASVAGLATYFTIKTFSGSFTYDLYRTKDKFDTGYGGTSKQYKFRYQNMKIKGSLWKYSIEIKFSEIGNWWWQSKPYL